MFAFTDEEMVKVLRASQFAILKHGHGRGDQTSAPYVAHVMETAEILVKEGGVKDCAAIVAAILHDVVEDARVDLTEIEKEFGADVAMLVNEVTDHAAETPSIRKVMALQRFKQMCHRAAAIKMAEAISNLRELLKHPQPNWDVQRVQGYALWYSCMFASKPVGLANRKLHRVVQNILENGRFTFNGVEYPLLPRNLSHEIEYEQLSAYWQQLDSACIQTSIAPPKINFSFTFYFYSNHVTCTANPGIGSGKVLRLHRARVRRRRCGGQ